jgi:hypothetical protein
MRRIIFLVPFLVIVLFSPNSTFTWYRFPYEDAVVVERSELMVVAHIKEGTIEYVPHQNTPNGGASWEYHVTLIATEVLKGKCNEKEIPIIIHYGLSPVIGGYEQRDGVIRLNFRGGREDYPKDIIEIYDTGNSGLSLTPLVKDAREDNLWFLRKRSGIYGQESGTGNYGIADPEELQPIELRDYFLAYMADNPETAVKEWAKKNLDKAGRAQRYFDHIEVQRILKIADVNDRLDKLQPYFLRRVMWDMNSEVKSGIISSGKAGGDYLMKVFDDPAYKQLRPEIILMWRDMKYKECVPFLIELLKKHDQFWATQKLESDWWSNETNHELTNKRREIYGEVYYGVCTLRSFKDVRARAILEATNDRWKAIAFDNTQILEECQRALKELAEIK